jgi:hypothetical protein
MATEGIDLGKFEEQLNNMTEEQLRAQLLAIKTKQAVNMKKYYNPENARRARLKRQAEIALMVEAAKKLGIYDGIKAEAKEKAEAIVAEEEAIQDAAE